MHRRLHTWLDIRFWGIIPALLWTLFFFLVPLLIMVMYSFWKLINYRVVPVWTLENYLHFFSKSFYRLSLWNSLVVTFWTVVISVLLAFPLAYTIAFKIPQRYQRFCLIATVVPFWTSYVIRSYSWLTVLAEKGVINSLLLRMGLLDHPFQVVYTRTATVIGFVHFFLMLLTLTIYASLVQIPPAYFRAAADLGAGRIKTFCYITLPLSLPGVMVGAFLTFVITFGDYITPQILGGNRELLLSQAIMLEIQHRVDYPMASTLGVIMMVVLGLGFWGFFKYLKAERW
ncbi:MAG: ABC transporter permease [Nitrospinota bacterium]|nr:MAG: ABC transporter permease [Nitrospinota bacterium]